MYEIGSDQGSMPWVVGSRWTVCNRTQVRCAMELKITFGPSDDDERGKRTDFPTDKRRRESTLEEASPQVIWTGNMDEGR